MALELARKCAFSAVITLVSYRRSENARESLKCPWHALTASGDDIYAGPWALDCMDETTCTWEEVEDNHYLHASNDRVAAFLRGSLKTVSSGIRTAREAPASTADNP